MQPSELTPGTQTRGSGKAVTGLVLGILSFLGLLSPIVGLVLAIIGIVMASMGRSSTRRGTATWGLVLSIIGLVLSLANGALGIYLQLHK